jgi:16S rRNA (guanine527-N7)-methyltransferase
MPLPSLDPETFARQLRRAAPEPLSPETVEALRVHYELLREWGRGLSLIGRGTEEEAIARHYGESLAALRWIEAGPEGSLLDLGSGAGFPGLVIAAARPRLRVWLIESRQRKWAFLRAVSARAALPCRCLNARVSIALPPEVPEDLDYVTVRAVKLSPATLTALLGRLSPNGALLWWRGAEAPELPEGWVVARETALQGTERRRVVEVRRKP